MGRMHLLGEEGARVVGVAEGRLKVLVFLGEEKAGEEEEEEEEEVLEKGEEEEVLEKGAVEEADAVDDFVVDAAQAVEEVLSTFSISLYPVF